MERISVTAEDIENGVPTAACACPIRLAIARALPRLVELDRYFTVAPVWVIGRGFAAKLPNEAQEFMKSFDDGYPVEPFEFDLDVRTLEA